jgi:MFS family permease
MCILGFALVILGQGFVKSFSGLIAARFFLSFAEAGIFPGSFYLISFGISARKHRSDLPSTGPQFLLHQPLGGF